MIFYLLVSLYLGVTEYITFDPFKPKYLEWYSPYPDPEHTIQVSRGNRVKFL